nr:uncharacterized protein LOC115268069 [Aedes albopictus]
MSYQQGKGRLYPRYSLNSSDNEDTPIHRSIYAQPYNSQLQQQSQQQPQTNLPIVLGGAGLQNSSCYSYRSSGKGSASVGNYQQQQQQQQQQHQQITTPSSDNGSSATLTDAEAALARENTLLVNNGE